MKKENKIPTFALAGNPNSGKTTLFNRLTGSSAEVGNWPGVTVEQKTGTAKNGSRTARIVDLPGIYSLASYTPEEAIAGNYLRHEKPDLILDVVDACNLERNLYLTTQLMETDLPMVIALTMTDAAERRGDRLDCRMLASLLGVPVVPVRASKGIGISELLDSAFSACGKPSRHHHVSPPSPGCKDPDLYQAETRYRYIESITARTARKSRSENTVTEFLDRFATGRFLAIPLFFAIILLVFWVTFGSLGAWLVWITSMLIDFCSAQLGSLLRFLGVSHWLSSLLLNGVLAGVGAVVKFLPQIILLFLLLSLLEDSGYMARAAFIMDAPMRKIGLSGRSFVPLLMGFGCTVPAVMGTRILENEKDRRLTILITPFLSCSAKLPVYSLVISVFFPGRQTEAMLLLYALGVGMGLLSAAFFKSSVLRGEPAPFLMELPDYRVPTWDNIRLHVGRRIRDFLRRAGTTVFLATVLVWLLQSVTPDLRMTEDGARSILALAGRAISPVFTFCGFADWRPAVALLTGLVAKESIVGTFGVLFAGNPAAGLRLIFTPVSACAFLLFVLFYTPCSAALAAIRRESGSMRLCLLSAFWQLATAYYVSALFYQCALLFGHLPP